VGVEIAIFTAVIIGVVAGLLLENYRRRIEPEVAGPKAAKVAPLRLTGPGARPAGFVDSAADLRLVSDAGFASKPLLSGREADVLGFVETAAAEAGQGWRVVPQVRLVDIIASSDVEANAVIGDHRLDMLIVSASHLPVAALDYQPLGQLKDDSALRDAIKREALRRADVPFIEIRANEPLDGIKAQILRLAAVPMPVKASRARAPARTLTAKAVTIKPAKPAAAPRPAAAKPAVVKAAAAKPVAVKAAAAQAAQPAVVAAPVVAPPAPAKPAAARPAPAAKKAPAKPASAAKAAPKPAAKTVPSSTAKPAAKPAPKPRPAAKAAPKDPPVEP
jgi:hypothetical protein